MNQFCSKTPNFQKILEENSSTKPFEVLHWFGASYLLTGSHLAHFFFEICGSKHHTSHVIYPGARNRDISEGPQKWEVCLKIITYSLNLT